MKNVIEQSVENDRFSIAGVYNHIFENDKYANYKKIRKETEKATNASIAKKILRGVLRFTFFIEPVKVPKIDSTKFAIRWSDRLLDDDPRKANFDICSEIFDSLLQELTDSLKTKDRIDLLAEIVSHTLVSYEINIDYNERILDAPMHTPENIEFFWGALPKDVVRLRAFLLNPANHDLIDFFGATYNKLAVKTYLTDRALTGEHKTNREKRWECHPASVHFALRKDALAIEEKLIEQICYFDGFPSELRDQLIEMGVFKAKDEVTKCPITLDPISFNDFREEVLSPTHGKASFQVGHMHPLKAIVDNPYTGHTAKNVSWISSQGNRIQGEYSVEETRKLIFRIIENYKKARLVD